MSKPRAASASIAAYQGQHSLSGSMKGRDWERGTGVSLKGLWGRGQAGMDTRYVILNTKNEVKNKAGCLGGCRACQRHGVAPAPVRRHAW